MPSEERMNQIFDASQQNLVYEKMDESLRPETDYFEGEQHKFNKFIIENDQIVPKEVVKMLWPFMDRELSLTNLDKSDIRWVMLMFDIAKIDIMMSKPDYQHSFEELRMIDLAKTKTFLKAMRSVGGQDRERAQLTTQIRELRIPEKARGGGPFGFVSRWFGGNR